MSNKNKKFHYIYSKLKSEGNSQFVLSKLEEQYNPKVRVIKHTFSRSNNPRAKVKDRTLQIQKQGICLRAIQSIKRGQNISIDWNTRSNFKSKKMEFPSIKKQLQTQPHQRSCQWFGKIKLRNIRDKNIEQKKTNLSLLLQQNECRKMSQKATNKQHKGSKSYKRAQTTKKSINTINTINLCCSSSSSRERILRVQNKIIQKSKLTVFKDDLRNKLNEIRQQFCTPQLDNP